MAADPIGGRYRLDSPLGGGMSEVWCAEDLELGRRVALKLLAPDADRARFRREARAAAALAHPHITQLYDYGEAGGRPFMVLEYLPGGTLEERLADGAALPDGETARIARDVADGLAHAHARGLVHRDLKPANILFDAEGRAKIADFGIAQLRGAGTLTQAGTVLGTAAYISPEQASGQTATPASDVYSFGAMLFRMLTGTLPFVSDDALTLVALHRDAQPPPVAEVRPDAPPALAALADAALAKDPAARPSDGAALVGLLGGAAVADAATGATQLLPGAAVGAVAGPPPVPTAPRRRRRLVFAVPLAVLAIAGAALGYGMTRHSTSPSLAATGGLLVHPAKHRRHRPVTTTAASVAAAATVSSAPTTTSATTTAATTTAARKRKKHATTTAPPATLPAATAPPPPTTAPAATTDTTATTAPATTAATTTGP